MLGSLEAAPQEQEIAEATINKTQCQYSSSMHNFHIIGSSTVIGLVGPSLLLFIMCGMCKFRDTFAQVNMEYSILVIHVLVLLIFLCPEQTEYRAVTICIHFFYMNAFAFLLMECVCVTKAMTSFIPINILRKKWQIFLAGSALPLVVIALSAGILYDSYPSTKYCWIKVNSDLLYPAVIPISIFASVGFILLSASLCCRPTDNYEVDEESFLRESVLENNRWIMLIILALMTVSWACGVAASEDSNDALALIFIIFNILLAVTIFILRFFGDMEVRNRLRMCWVGGTVAPEDDPMTVFLAKKQLQDSSQFKIQYPPIDYLDPTLIKNNKAYVFQP